MLLLGSSTTGPIPSLVASSVAQVVDCSEPEVEQYEVFPTVPIGQQRSRAEYQVAPRLRTLMTSGRFKSTWRPEKTTAVASVPMRSPSLICDSGLRPPGGEEHGPEVETRRYTRVPADGYLVHRLIRFDLDQKRLRPHADRQAAPRTLVTNTWWRLRTWPCASSCAVR